MRRQAIFIVAAFLVSFLSLLLPSGTDAAIPASERAALIALYNATNGDQWERKDGWLGPAGTECDWWGVACNGDYVYALWLNWNNLDGQIPIEITQLTGLIFLDLHSNELHGPIPPEIGTMTSLGGLYISWNQFDPGPVPTWINNLPNLFGLALSGTRRTGPLPDWIGSISNLRDLYLGYNNFDPGPIPQSWSQLTSLEGLWLDYANLSGSIPLWISQCSNMESLNLSDNQLAGPVPQGFSGLDQLRLLYLSDNNLSGPLPDFFGGMTNLTDLTLYDNSFSPSPLPSSLRNLQNLRLVKIDNLTGGLPTWIGNWVTIDTLFLWDGQLAGPIPDSIGQLTDLDNLWLNDNELSGELPASMLNLTELNDNYGLDICGNDLYTASTQLRDFLNSKQRDGDWEGCQTGGSSQAPTANFDWSPLWPVSGEPVSLNDQSSNNPTSWSWDFDDGNTSQQQNPSHTYQNSGSFQVTLTVANAHGSDAITKTVTVAPGGSAPNADFTWSPTSPNLGDSVQFTDQSSNSPTSWSWDFDDGGSSTSQNPSHVFQDAGSFSVTLTASNAHGPDSRTKTITVTDTPGNTVTVGGITFSADSVQTTSFGYRLTGAVSINDVIEFDGALELREPDAGSTDFRMEGDGQLIMPGVSLPGLGTLVLYEGEFSIPFLDGSLFGIPEEGTGIEVAGWVVRIDDLDFAGGGIEIAGALSIPQYAPGWPNVYAAASFRISQAHGFELLGGEVDIDKIQLYGAFSLEDLHVVYDGSANSFAGEGTLKTAAFGLKVGVDIIDSCPNGVTITVTHPHVNIPNTPLALANYGVDATGFCPDYDFGIGLHTDITVLGLPDPDLLSFADVYVMYYPLTTLSGGGKVRILTVDVASADFYVNDGANGCAGGVCFRSMVGLPSLEEPWLLGQIDMSIMTDPLEFSGMQSMAVQIPDTDDLPLLAGMVGFACCGGDYPCPVGNATVASRVRPYGDPVGEFNGRVSTCLMGLDIDVTVTYSEGGDEEFHVHFFEDGEMVKLAPASNGLKASSTTFLVPDGTTDAYLLAHGLGSVTPEFSIVDPDGVRYDEDGGLGVAYVEDASRHAVMFGIENPTPGSWLLEVSNLDPAEVELTGYTLGTPLTVEVVDVRSNGGDVLVDWRGIGQPAGDTVDLLYCSAFDGPPIGTIVEDLAASANQHTETWDTTGVASGVYYVRARTGSGQSEHTFEEPVIVSNTTAPQPPANLHGNTSGASAAVLSWQPSPSPTVTGYIVSVRQGAASQVVEIGVGGVTSYRLQELDGSAGYEIWVSAYDTDGVRSEPSNVVRLAWAACDLSCTTTTPPVAGRGDPIQFASTVTSMGCSGEPRFGWDFGDGSSGNQPSPKHTYASSDTYSWTFIVSQDGEACHGSGMISIEDHTCTITVLVPGDTPSVPRLGQTTVRWAAAGSACSSGFDIDLYRFGTRLGSLDHEAEGSSFAWLPSGDLVEGDGYQIRVRDRNSPTFEGLSATFSLVEGGTSSPPVAAAGDEMCLIPAAAHVGGVGDTNWVTDVVLHNPGDSTSGTNVYFLPRSQDNRSAPGRQLAISPGESRRLDDIVMGTFGLDSAAGAIMVGSTLPLVVTSRIYNDVPSGTYGQFVAGMDTRNAMSSANTARLIQLTQNSEYRTNIGFANAGDQEIQVDVNLYRASGGFIQSEQYTIPAFGSHQANGIIDANVSDAFAIISSPTTSARYFTYASIVDNLSGDSVYVTPVDEVSGESVYVPGAAHLAGAAGTNWRTDLEVHNAGQGTASFTLELLKRDQANPSPPSATYTLGNGASRRFTDVVESVFGLSTMGAIRVTPSSGALAVTSRTYNDAESGTFGQFIAGLPASAATPHGSTARISQLERSANPDSGFRTNIGLVNVGPSAIDVDIELFDGVGNSLGTLGVTLRRFETRQVNDVFGEVTQRSVDNGYAVLRTTSPGGSFLAYGSVVDNRSGDPIYIPGATLGSGQPLPPTVAPVLTASDSSSTRIDLSWTSVPGATGYKLYRVSSLIYSGNGRAYVDSGLSSGTRFCYTVRAYNAGGDGPVSAQRCATTHPDAPTCGSWQWINNTATNQHLYGVTWGGGRFVAVGTGGTIVTSTDGTSWSSQSSGTQEFLVRIAYGAGRYVAVGYSGTLLTSDNGVSWTSRFVPTSENLVDVSWINNRFVVTGTAGVVMESSDGLSWNPVAPVVNDVLNGASWTGSRFVVVGSRNDFADGVALVGANISSLELWPNGQRTDVALFGTTSAGNGTSIAVGRGGRILQINPNASSPTNALSPTTEDLYAIDFRSGRYSAVGADGTIVTSTNGSSWTSEPSGVTRSLNGIALGDGVNITVGLVGTTVRQECSQ